jgi:shikimate kinase
MNLILFGFTGCGKTHLAKALSSAIKCPFIDTDERIIAMYQRQSGMTFSIRDIHEKLGEIAFREWEKKAIFALEKSAQSIIALGGGAVLDLSNVQHLSSIGRLVYLKSDFDRIKEKIAQRGIPSFADPVDPIASLSEIYKKRVPIYESIPSRWIDIDTQDDTEVVAALSEEFYAL